MTFPLGLQRRHVDDDAATRIGALAEADRQYVARNPEIFDGARQRERIGRDDAALSREIHEVARIEILGIDDGRVDVGEDLELACAAHVVAVAGRAIRHDAAAVVLLDLARLEWLDHAMLLRHVADPVVALDAHERSTLVGCRSPPAKAAKITGMPDRRQHHASPAANTPSAICNSRQRSSLAKTASVVHPAPGNRTDSGSAESRRADIVLSTSISASCA